MTHLKFLLASRLRLRVNMAGFFLAGLTFSGAVMAQSVETGVSDLKQQIVSLAKSYEGQGDPDQSKQKTIEVLVDALVAHAPMPPVKERIPLLAGAWKQVWGPYDYRNDNGGVDPILGVHEIYQVIFADGYYYNVSPLYPKGDVGREQIGLLRGEFRLDPKDPNALRVKFTAYPGVKPRPTQTNLWDLAAVAESGCLQNAITIVPSWVVRFFFGGGKLEEVYTDTDLRILYGSNGKVGARRSIYVMTRVR